MIKLILINNYAHLKIVCGVTDFFRIVTKEWLQQKIRRLLVKFFHFLKNEIFYQMNLNSYSNMELQKDQY